MSYRGPGLAGKRDSAGHFGGSPTSSRRCGQVSQSASLPVPFCEKIRPTHQALPAPSTLCKAEVNRLGECLRQSSSGTEPPVQLRGEQGSSRHDDT